MLRSWIPYQELMQALQLSKHGNQLAKRKAKYPTHFCRINGEEQISSELCFALINYQSALATLNALKTKGGTDV